MNVRRRLNLFIAVLATVIFCVQWAGQNHPLAHPVAQGRMDVVIHPDHVHLTIQVALEEVCISNSLFVNSKSIYKIGEEHVAKHGEYLSQHVFVYADGKPLSGRVVKKEMSAEAHRELGPEELQKENATYELDYALAKDAPPPATILLKQNVLNEIQFSPGNAWQATYVIVIGQVERQATEGLLLTSTQPVVYPCDWSAAPATTIAPDGTGKPLAPKTDSGETFKTFMKHGIYHILEGYDHMLFVTALVLAAVSFWDLVKVVSTFTLSHSLTLGLSVFNIVRLDSSIVEPMIAASIVFVALQNAFFPQRSRGWIRLGAAFFFGLFHGLGFAGGCLDAMEGMHSSTVLLAIVAFSLGVELGHQMVVLPIFGLLTAVRRWKKEPERVEKFNAQTLKYGSIMISVAGIFYLINALGWVHFLDEEKPDAQKKTGQIEKPAESPRI